VVVFGLFHGLVFLPVLLSLVGPTPYEHIITSENEAEKAKNEINSTSKSQGIDNKAYFKDEDQENK